MNKAIQAASPFVKKFLKNLRRSTSEFIKAHACVPLAYLTAQSASSRCFNARTHSSVIGSNFEASGRENKLDIIKAIDDPLIKLKKLSELINLQDINGLQAMHKVSNWASVPSNDLSEIGLLIKTVDEFLRMPPNA